MNYCPNLNKKLNTLLILGFIFLSFACDSKKKDDDKMPQLYAQPKTFPLKLGGDGYKVNPFTGDSIRPIVNRNGDTLKTGVPIKINLIPINDEIIKEEIVITPQVYEIIPKIIPAKFTKKITPKYINTFPIKKTLDKNFKKNNQKTSHLINIFGDTIPTSGNPIETICKKLTTKTPIPIKASNPQLNQYKSYTIRNIIEEQGIGNSKIKTIFEDTRGFFWISTDGGMSKFDGHNYWKYNIEVGFPLSTTLTINEDSQGNIWFGTTEGIIKYDGVHFFKITNLEETVVFTVYSSLIDSSGYLWFGTSMGIFIYTDGNLWKYNDTRNNPNFVYSIIEDNENNIWYSGTNEGVGMFDGQKIFSLNILKKPKDSFVKTIFQDLKGDLWFGTVGEGVYKYSNDSISEFSTKNGLAGNIIESISEVIEGNIWFGTYENGISNFDGESFTNISINEGLTSNHITSTLKSKSGQLWIGTENGISIYAKKPFIYFGIKDGSLGKPTSSIFEDSSGIIWFSIYGESGGLIRYDGKNFNQYSKDGIFGTFRIKYFYEDRSNNIWIIDGFSNLWKFTKNKFLSYSNKNGFSDETNFSNINEDSTGRIWFGTLSGEIINYDNNKFTCFKGNYLDQKGFMSSLYCDNKNNTFFNYYEKGLLKCNGNKFWEYSIGTDFDQTFPFFNSNTNMEIWFDTKYGIAKSTNENVIHYTVNEGLFTYKRDRHSFQKNKFRDLIYTNENGLTILSNERIEIYTEKEGLINNNITSVINDNNGNIWLGTEKGLTLLANKTNNAIKTTHINDNSPYTLISYTRKEGLISERFNGWYSKPILDSKNRIWWGNNMGFTVLDLNVFSLNKNPKVHLNNIKINELFYDFNNLQQNDSLGFSFTGSTPFYSYPKDLVLDYEKNHLTFQFLSPVDFAALHKIKYSYKIDGIDKSWSVITEKTEADYRNLPYGKHTFKVCALSEDAIWGEPFEYTFTILPPWWHTWWARTGYALSLLLLIYGIIRWQTAKLKARQKELEDKVDIATHEIREQKENIEEAHKEIKSSINYARRIQNAILPPPRIVKEYLKDSFILYKPKDVVAGDFYWMEQKDGHVLFAAADCTGHGVPGAMVSVVCNNALNRSVREFALRKPGEILDKTREMVVEEFDKASGDVKDGMDIALCSIKGRKLQYAGAHNPLWIIRNGEILETKANKQPIGKYDNPKPYTTHAVNLEKGDTLYVFTDGYVDQFGGEKGKKFMVKAFRKLILSIQDKTMEEQKTIINQTFEQWKGNLDQVDDVCVIGVRV